MIDKIKVFLAERLTEKTTWIGLFTIIAAMGTQIAPELSEAISTFGVILGGIVLIFTKEKSGNLEEDEPEDRVG